MPNMNHGTLSQILIYALIYLVFFPGKSQHFINYRHLTMEYSVLP